MAGFLKARMLILLAVSILFFSNRIYACKCAGESPVKEEIRFAETIVVGTVISKELVKLPDSTLMKTYKDDSLQFDTFPFNLVVSKYGLSVETTYKGEGSSKIIYVFTGMGHGDCGFNFKIGEKYIIYGMKETYIGQMNNEIEFPMGDDIIWTSICRRTTIYSSEEIDEINRCLENK